MSWAFAAYALLGVALAAGFAWYERTKPDARIVALVGTLAAFAALGRIAFAAIPNVKPTSDIVLISGYALGGAPGFVVGAVAGLTSNFFFGQGPWTPWQMAGWGATGILGAGLAAATRGRIGRWPLALACCAAGFAFTVLQDAGDWVTYSDHSLAQLGVYVGKGLGFDGVHAAGCLLFALAFGPALNHSLRRFRVRLHVVWIASALLLLIPGLALAGATPAGYLRSAQNPDGGFGAAPHQPSSSLFSGWAALGLRAAGVAPGARLLAYLERHPGTDPGSLERSILAIRACGGDATWLARRLQRDIRRDGSVAEQTSLTAFAVLALRAAELPRPARMIRWLVRQQDGDGGFNFATGSRQTTSDSDDTGAVLEALSGAGHAETVRRAIRFLEHQENRDGGFPAQPGAASNAQSTAFAAQGLIAVGVPAPRAQRYLRSLIAPDGHVAYARGQDQTPVWVTAQAEAALAGRPLPLPPPVRIPPRAPTAAPKPAARRPPARRPPAKPVHRRATPHHVRPRPSVRHPVRSPELDLREAASVAGALFALVLAPLGNV
jgi:energy-coupling factor transport system substrate-specific component